MSYKDIRKELNNILSLEDAKYSQETMDVTDGCAKNLIAIQMDNSTSLEHWDNIVKSCINEGILMQHFNLVPIAERNRKKVIIKNMIHNNLSMEEVTHTAEVLSLEGVKEFGKKMIEGIKHVWQKIAEAGAAFIRMLQRFVGSQIAKLQSSYYEKNKGKIPSAKMGGAGKKVLKFKPFKVKLSDIKSLTTEVINSSEKIEKLVEAELSPGKVSEHMDLVGKIGTALPKAMNGTQLSPREVAVKEFFGVSKVPNVVEKPAHEWLDQLEFAACSKEFLDNLRKMDKAGEMMLKASNRAIKKIQDAAKKWENDERKAGGDRKEAVGSNEYKDEKKALLKKASLLSSKILSLQVYFREIFLLALDYRTSAYKAAKQLIGDYGKAVKDIENENKKAKKNK